MKSKIISLATSKGGTGKSTLARSLGAYWLNLGFKVAIIDADPQGSIIGNHSDNGPLSKMHVIADPEESVGNTVKEIDGDFDYILIDTGGFRNRTTVMALLSCDYVLIPLKPSSDDVKAALDTYTLIQELNETPERENNPIKYDMIITMSQQGIVIAKHVRAELEKMNLNLLKSEMFNRVAYPETAISGLSPCVTSPDGAASRDIANIVKELSSRQ